MIDLGIPKLLYGVYDITGIEHFEFRGSDTTSVEAFQEAHPEAVYGMAYQGNSCIVLARAPEVYRPAKHLTDARAFAYGSVILTVETAPITLLFVMNS